MAQSIKYELTTPKGETIAVDASQAGEIITTASGETVEVPTFRELKKLPLIREEIEVNKKIYWNPTMGVLFSSGALILLISLSVGGYYGYYFYHLPAHIEKPDVPEGYFSKAIEDMPLAEILEHWEEFQKPHAVSMYRTGLEDHQLVPLWRDHFIEKLTYCVIAGAIGLIMLVIPLVVGVSNRK